MGYDRSASDRLLQLLSKGGVLHPLLQRVLADRARLDLQLRGYPHRATCWATIYAGLTGVLHIYENRGLVRFSAHGTHMLAGNFEASWRVWRNWESLASIVPDLCRYADIVLETLAGRHTDVEGAVHATLSSGRSDDLVVIDREAAVIFKNQREKDAVMVPLIEKHLHAVQVATGGASWGSPLHFGTEVDFLGLDRRGRLLVIEAKPARSTVGIAFGPAQVSLYAHLFWRWAQQDTTAAVATLRHMLRQRQQLGLAPAVSDIGEPFDITPVVVIGGHVRSVLAIPRLEAMQQALLREGVGWRSLELWTERSGGQWHVQTVV